MRPASESCRHRFRDSFRTWLNQTGADASLKPCNDYGHLRHDVRRGIDSAVRKLLKRWWALQDSNLLENVVSNNIECTAAT